MVKWFEKTEAVIRISGCTPRQSVMYSTNLFLDQALTWWNGQVQSLGDDSAYSLSWTELKELMIAEYRPASEVQKLETEFWNLTMMGADVTGYTSRFHDLARLVPRLVTPENNKIERYLFGLAPQIRSMVTASKPTTMRAAIDLALSLTEDAIRMGTLIRQVSGLKISEASSVEAKNQGTSSAVVSNDQGNKPRFGKRKRDEGKGTERRVAQTRREKDMSPRDVVMVTNRVIREGIMGQLVESATAKGTRLKTVVPEHRRMEGLDHASHAGHWTIGKRIAPRSTTKPAGGHL